MMRRHISSGAIIDYIGENKSKIICSLLAIVVMLTGMILFVIGSYNKANILQNMGSLYHFVKAAKPNM